MTYVIMTPKQSSELYAHAAVLREVLAVLPVVDLDRVSEPGVDQALEAAMEERDIHLQAIDAFMDERRDSNAAVRYFGDTMLTIADEADAAITTLKREVRNASDRVANQRGALNGQLRLLKEKDAILAQVGAWNAKLRERLEVLGITITTDVDGDPALTVNILELTNTLDRHFQAA